jgi:hypothetical protein
MKSTVFSRLCLAVAVCQLLTFFLPFPWDYVLYAPWHYLLWAFISSGNLYCALALLTLYVVVQVLTRRKQQKSVTASADGVPVTEQSPPEVALVLKSKAFAVIACLALITILVGPFVVFGLASTVCEGSGLVNTVSATIENVVLSKAKQKHELADDATKKQRLEDLSKVVFAEGLLKCDMIVTATEAKRTHGEWSQPREKYFIAMTNENRKALLSDQDDPIKKLIRPEAYETDDQLDSVQSFNGRHYWIGVGLSVLSWSSNGQERSLILDRWQLRASSTYRSGLAARCDPCVTCRPKSKFRTTRS